LRDHCAIIAQDNRAARAQKKKSFFLNLVEIVGTFALIEETGSVKEWDLTSSKVQWYVILKPWMLQCQQTS